MWEAKVTGAGRVPAVFRGELYATPALAGSVVVVALAHTDLSYWTIALLGSIMVSEEPGVSKRRLWLREMWRHRREMPHVQNPRHWSEQSRLSRMQRVRSATICSDRHASAHAVQV